MNSLAEILKGDPWEVVRQLHKLEEAARTCRLEIQRSAGQNSIDSIVHAVASELGVKEVEIFGRGRKAEVALARQVAMVLAVDVLGVSHSEAGRLLSRNHATVFHAQKAVADACATRPRFAAQVERLRQRLQSIAPQRPTITEIAEAA